MTNEVYLVHDTQHPEQMCVFSSLKNVIAYVKDYAEDEIKHYGADSYEMDMDEDSEIYNLDHDELVATIEYGTYHKYIFVQLCYVDEYLPE